MKLKFSVLGLVVVVMSLLVAGQAKADTVTTDATTNQPLSGYVFTANRVIGVGMRMASYIPGS